ncbi:Gfo/Idh/MocA family protein [Cohnella fermenti]|uniref:Gfo/Idh/MocA family oxidoreductase n=1 Tax=Cohnella fermenti TaxID=2565925 RepID=A0A4S4BI19_9BACL|nr:Gfo/Idh/MocA family oxidoreductase [Cohnella fermenti]THF73995.1 Gfo/Idh/MocA family oxidoreductase [Cohnella fermenti]
MAKTVNIGVIGTGSISFAHLDAYAAHPDVKLVAVADMNAERAAETARKYNAERSYSNVSELLADPQIDAVSICTWNNTHADLAIQAIRAGKHVLVEKPLSRTVEEALRVQEAVRSSDRILQVGFVRRFDPNAQLLKRFAELGEFGELYYAKASNLRRLGNPGGWFADVARSGGGPLIDIGVHVIDLIWYLMGKPKPVSVSGNVYHKLGNRSNVQGLSFYKAADYDASLNTVEDLANAVIRFENGASLLVDVSFTLHASKDESFVKLFGTKGGFEVDPEVKIATEKHDIMVNIAPQTDDKGFNFAKAFQEEIAHFVASVQNGTEPLSPVEDGVAVMKMLRAVYESAEKGIEIRLD